MIKWPKLIISVLICQAAGWIGFLFSPKLESWYAILNKPSFTPPNEIFAPVWTLLYFLMGISVYLIWNEKRGNIKWALYMFGIQLVLNVIWTISFFGLLSPLLSFTICIYLLFAIAYTTYLFYKISKKAAYLMLPYLIWVGFATILNYYIWILNA